ncbi:hypothetical protein NC651_002755 [Populus alba x Populus x berolinensis]|nr:hypothetical protein NC651_002755 [Populus alba x Populus x berolinensis]
MKTLISPTGTVPSRCATAMEWISQDDLADEQMDFIWRIAIGTYASYLSSTTVLPSKKNDSSPSSSLMRPNPAASQTKALLGESDMFWVWALSIWFEMS